MEYIKYGNAGIVVSRLCWGAMNFFQRGTEEEAHQMVDDALEAGINFFDTADAYGRGRSEEVLGPALKSVRDHIVLATKLWVPMYKEDKNGRGCGRYHLMRAVEDSLRRLGTDRIDLYQLHHPDKNAPIEETMSTMDMLIKQGKVRYFGVSNHYAWQMAQMLGVAALHNWEPLVSIQHEYNLFHRTAELETAHFCRRFNIAAMTYSPLCAGLLSGKVKRGQELPEGSRAAHLGIDRMAGKLFALDEEQRKNHVYDVLDELEKIASKYEVGVNQLAVKWVLSKDWITSPIIGGSRREHFTQMYSLFDWEIDDADIEHIDEITKAYIYVPFGNQAMIAGAASQDNWW